MASKSLLPLKDLVVLMRNGTTKTQNTTGSGFPVTRIETISEERINVARVRHVELSDAEVEKWKLSSGDILLSHINSVEHIGKSSLYEGNPEVLIHGMNLLLLRPDISKILPDYLHFVLKSINFREGVRGRCKRAINQASINQKELGSILVPYYALDEQRRIVDILKRADSIRRLRKQALETTRELIPALFVDMFGDPATNPKELRVEKISSLTQVQTGSTPSRKKPEYYVGEIPWVKTAEVNGSKIFDSEEHISESAIAETNCKVFPQGTVLIAMYGQGITRGRSGILALPCATNQACAAILPSEQLDELFLFYQMQVQYSNLRELGHGGNQPNLNLGMVKNFPILVPSKDSQKSFSEKVSALTSVADMQEKHMQESNSLVQSLMSQFFN